MKHHIIIVHLCAILLTSCAKESASNPFLIQKHRIGLLTDSTTVKELNAVFAKDSVVRYIAGDEFAGSVNLIEVFEKGGKKLLDLTPEEALDSTSVISTVRIIDKRYKTEKDISVLSTFGDLQKAYKISKIDNLINAIVVSVNELNASFTIDKNELPASLRFDMTLSIDAIQIPVKAKIKYFMLHW